MKIKRYILLSGAVLLFGGFFLIKEFIKVKKVTTIRTKEENSQIIVNAKKHGNYSTIIKFDEDFLNDWANGVILGESSFVHAKTGKIHNTLGGKTVN